MCLLSMACYTTVESKLVIWYGAGELQRRFFSFLSLILFKEPVENRNMEKTSLILKYLLFTPYEVLAKVCLKEELNY